LSLKRQHRPRRLWRDASGRLTFHVSTILQSDYPVICHAISRSFGLIHETAPVFGPEQMFWDFRCGEQLIGLDWDIWMGFIAVAKTEGSEALVRDIASWFRSSPWGG
jgi:hypothetical protein